MLLALIDHRIDLPGWAFVESLVPQPFVGFVARELAFVLIAYWMDWEEGGSLGPEKAFVRTEQRLDPADHLDDQVEKLYFQIVPCLSLIHISEPTRLGMISYAVFCLK